MRKISKRLLSVALVVVMLVAVSLTGVSAATFIYDDGFKFTRESTGGTTTITIHEYVGTEPSVVIPSTLVSQNVTAIADYAFMNNSVIKTMTIPNTITSLGRGAFYGCSTVESVSLPKNCTQIGQYMFYECDSLKSVTLPTMLKEVPRYCFAHCDSIESISLPSSARTISDYAFTGCSNLKDVYVSRYTNSISDTAFDNSPQVVIHGYLNTYAHEYAIEHSIPFSAIDATAETLYVTFYDYDGSVFLTIPVRKGNTISFPSVTPEKPGTDTHYYEFAYWDGNVSNIQKNEFVYPVYTEHERFEPPQVINKYSVVFLNGDDVFMEAQMVEEGANATEPETIPTKKSTPSHSYVFSGWDTSFKDVRENLVVRPTFEEHLIEYTVKFVSTDDEVLSEQILNYGQSAVAPQAPEIEGYTFAGWDKEFDFIKEDLIIKPVYEKNEPPKEQPVRTEGKLRIELAGGNSFTIDVNGKGPRPQGASYINTKMPIGATVTVVAQQVEGVEFLGWMNESGAFESVTDTYTFTTSGNDYLKAAYKTVVQDVNTVIFMNTRAADGRGQVIDMQYYATGDEIIFPADASLAGFDFTGWSLTAEEIQGKLAAGEDVIVEANFTRSLVYIDITVNGGTAVTAPQSNGKYLAYGGFEVKADTAPEGKKFSHWVDATGKIMSYDETYKSYPAENLELTAVFVATDEVIEKQPLAFLTGDPTITGEKITYTMSWDIDESIGTVTAAGLVAVDKNDYNEGTFWHGSGDSKLFDRALGSAQIKPKNTASINLSDRFYDHTYYAVTFVIYTDAKSGESVTIYSDRIETYKPAP